MNGGAFPGSTAPSVFGRLLDDDAGHFALQVAGAQTSRRRYLDSTLTLETTIGSDDGEVVMTDTLAMATGVRGHDLGKDSPHLLLRRVRCSQGRVGLRIEFRPRFEYGLTVPILVPVNGGVLAEVGPGP